MIETIKLSEKARNQLITLKRRTGLQNWNVLCRWAFCISLAEQSSPPKENIPSDSAVEMTWKVFSGGAEDVYWALLVVRAKRDGVSLDKESLNTYFRLHLHRGISYLTGNSKLRGIADLGRLAVSAAG
jgi:DNA sulfur modification protein DndE